MIREAVRWTMKRLSIPQDHPVRRARSGHKNRSWPVGRVLALAALALRASRASGAAPELSFVDATLRLQSGSGDRVGRIMIKAEGGAESIPANTDIRIKDLGSPEPAGVAVEFEAPIEVDHTSTSRTWLVAARVRGLALNSSQRRFARLTYGSTEHLVGYIVTNLPLSGFSWSVAIGQNPWLVRRGLLQSSTTTPVLVTTVEGSATGLRLALASLRDGLGLSDIKLDELELCSTAAGPCQGTHSVDSGSNRTFFLRLKSTNAPWTWRHGKYTGTVSFAVNERPDPQTVSVTLYATSWLMRLLGVFLLIFGAALGL